MNVTDTRINKPSHFPGVPHLLRKRTFEQIHAIQSKLRNKGRSDTIQAQKREWSTQPRNRNASQTATLES